MSLLLCRELYEGSYRTDLKTLNIVQPDGPSWTVSGQQGIYLVGQLQRSPLPPFAEGGMLAAWICAAGGNEDDRCKELRHITLCTTRGKQFAIHVLFR